MKCVTFHFQTNSQTPLVLFSTFLCFSWMGLWYDQHWKITTVKYKSFIEWLVMVRSFFNHWSRSNCVSMAISIRCNLNLYKFSWNPYECLIAIVMSILQAQTRTERNSAWGYCPLKLQWKYNGTLQKVWLHAQLHCSNKSINVFSC